jgi:hypothetical protein
LFHFAWVKLNRHVIVAAVCTGAGAFEVELPAVSRCKTDDSKGSGGAGVGGGKPASKRVVLAGRRDPRPEGPKLGVKLGVDPCLSALGVGLGAVDAAASCGAAASRWTSAASAGAIAVACAWVALGCGGWDGLG